MKNKKESRRKDSDRQPPKDKPKRRRFSERSTRNDLTEQRAIELLESKRNDPRFSEKWTDANIKAIETGNYQPLAKLYFEHEFIGRKGDFIIAVPYSVLREASKVTKFSVLVGQIIHEPELKAAVSFAEKLQGEPLRESVNRMLVVETNVATGSFDGRNGGEAFIVPDGVDDWKETEVLPALFNATELFRRTKKSIKRIELIFDSETAKVLTAPLHDWESYIEIQSLEYGLHDVGHHSGLGLNFKLANNLLPDYWIQGIEEWRSDSIDFAVAAQILPSAAAEKIVASNFVTRFGMDAHRSGGVDGDYDIVVVLWLLQHLLRNGSLTVKHNKLSIRNVGSGGLLEAVKSAAAEGVALTRAELKLEQASGIARLYNFKIDEDTLEFFNEYVLKPCKSIETNLR